MMCEFSKAHLIGGSLARSPPHRVLGFKITSKVKPCAGASSLDTLRSAHSWLTVAFAMDQDRLDAGVGYHMDTTEHHLSAASATPARELGAFERRTIAKVAGRLLPFLFIGFFLAFIDRVNVGFANATMSHDLGLSAAAFGRAAGVFFVGYVVFEVPSNLWDAICARAISWRCTRNNGPDRWSNRPFLCYAAFTILAARYWLRPAPPLLIP
jgi:hypothetical protein